LILGAGERWISAALKKEKVEGLLVF
jgi:hypothetical protein